MSENCRTCGEAYATGGDGFDGECPDCADRSCLMEEEVMDGGEVEAVRKNIRVVLSWIGEGNEGDYHFEDPDDTPLIRFDVYGMGPDLATEDGYEEGVWAPFRDASYCTAIDAQTPYQETLRATFLGNGCRSNVDLLF